MHKYTIRRYNQNYKIFKSAPTYFGSQRIYHQGALYSKVKWSRYRPGVA